MSRNPRKRKQPEENDDHGGNNNNLINNNNNNNHNHKRSPEEEPNIKRRRISINKLLINSGIDLKDNDIKVGFLKVVLSEGYDTVSKDAKAFKKSVNNKPYQYEITCSPSAAFGQIIKPMFDAHKEAQDLYKQQHKMIKLKSEQVKCLFGALKCRYGETVKLQQLFVEFHDEIDIIIPLIANHVNIYFIKPVESKTVKVSNLVKDNKFLIYFHDDGKNNIPTINEQKYRQCISQIREQNNVCFIP